MKKMGVFLLIVIQTIHILAQQAKNYHTIKLSAELKIFPQNKMIKGKLIYELIPDKNTGQIKIDAKGIYFTNVKKGLFNQRISFDGKQLTIYKRFKKGKKYKFKLQYIAYPTQAMYFVGWEAKKGKKQIWTQGQGKGNSHWLPQNENQNDKFPWKLTIDFDEKYQVVSNGNLNKKEKRKNNKICWIYEQSQPAPGYLMFLGIGNYTTDSLISRAGKKIYNYQYPLTNKKEKTFYKSKEIFDFIENEIGVPYPWTNYKQIPLRDFLYGGMENVSVSSFNGNRYVVDSIAFNDINFVNVSAHELAHQWFGDLVTGKSSSDHWLHEGFATYYARLNDEYIFGKDYLDYEILKYDEQIKKAAKNDTIPIHRPNASSLSYYQKGARVVQMLREKIGEKNFKNTISSFLNNHRYKNVEIKDLQREIYLQTGDSLTSFFDLWLDSTKIPVLQLAHRNDSIIFEKNELPQPIPFLFIYKDSTLQTKYFSSDFIIPDFHNLVSLVPNTDNRLLMNLKFQSHEGWLKNQALKSPYFSDRYTALKKLKTSPEIENLYNILLKRNEFYPIYEDIIEYAIKNRKDSFIDSLFNKDLKTRQLIAISLQHIPIKLKEKYKSLIQDPSYITKEAVLWRYAMNFPGERYSLLQQTAHISGSNDKSFRITWLTLTLITPQYSAKEKGKFFQEIKEYTSPAHIIEVRLNAFAALDALNSFDKESLRNLMNASLHFNWHLHRPARILLKKLYHNNKYHDLIEELIQAEPEKEKEFFKKLLNQN